MRISIKILLLLQAAQIISFAQLGKDSLYFSAQSFSEKFLINNFEKQLNTYNLNTLVKYYIASEKLFFGLKENFNSTVTKSTTKNIKDEQFFWAFGQFNFSELLKFGLMLNNNFYTDDRQLAINKTSLLTASLFAKFLPMKNFEVTPYGGFSQNNQIGETNNGFIYGTEVNIDKLNMGEFDLTSMMKFQNEDISPRKNLIRLLNFDLNNTFEESFTNTVSASYSIQRKDFYFTADPATAAEFNLTNNIQSRSETSYFLQDRIKFIPTNSPFSFDLQGKIAWRGIDRDTRYISSSTIANTNFDTHIEELRLDFASSAQYLEESFNLSLRFAFSERDEKHQPKQTDKINSIVLDERQQLEEQKNNISQLTNISIINSFNLSFNDRLTFSIFHRKLKYDTPSNQNFDDRDELLSIGRILFEKKINPFFKIFANLEGSLNKTVYIFAERSSNNNVKRIIKCSSGGSFTSGSFTSSNSAEVSANYTVLDYEELNPNFRSYSFRQMAIRDSSSYKFNSPFRIFFTGYIKLSEQGDFKWSSFAGKPQRYLNEQYSETKIYYENNFLTLGLGIRYFSLETFNIKNGVDKERISEYRSIGPLTELSYIISERIDLRLYGWYEFIKSEDNSKREMGNFSLKLNYKI